MTRYGTVLLILSLSSACGEDPAFNGTEFHFVIGSDEQTITIDQPVRECDWPNEGRWGLSTDAFEFVVASIEPGTYTGRRYESSRDAGFLFQGEIAGRRIIGTSDICESGVSMTIDGEDYGLTHGTLSGAVCPSGTEQPLGGTFTFATKTSGVEDCP